MSKLPSRLRRLDDALASIPIDDEAMLLSELDGFLTGIAVCPAPILPGEWLPLVWGGGPAPFDDPVDMHFFTDMVVARYNEIARDLGRDRLQPIFDIDERNGDVLWELWMNGFADAQALRPERWSAVTQGDDAEAAEAAEALATLQLLIAVARDESALTSDEINQICDRAPALIDRHMAPLHAWRLRHVGPAAVTPEPKPAKIGRNDPCACGSGRKYKRCCGAG